MADDPIPFVENGVTPDPSARDLAATVREALEWGGVDSEYKRGALTALAELEKQSESLDHWYASYHDAEARAVRAEEKYDRDMAEAVEAMKSYYLARVRVEEALRRIATDETLSAPRLRRIAEEALAPGWK